MDATMKENIQKIHSIENKYGLVLFRMGLTHLVDVGVRHLNDEAVEDCILQIMEQEKADKAKGSIPVMTPEFRCAIVRCAAELARFGIWTLFAYIKKHVEVGNV